MITPEEITSVLLELNFTISRFGVSHGFPTITVANAKTADIYNSILYLRQFTNEPNEPERK